MILKISAIKNNYNSKSSMTYNTEFIKLLSELEELMKKKGEHFRARAYTKAKEAIILIKQPITEVSQLKGVKGIGNSILTKLQEFVDTGTLSVLEKAKNNPVFIFTDVYGIGPKKASELVRGDRHIEYGDKTLNHINIAGLWSSYLNVVINIKIKVFI